MLLAFLSRETLLPFLPPDAVVAEIGTAKGNFAAALLNKAKPRRLHLIDPWEKQDRADYARDDNNVDDAEGEARYRAVLDRFAAPIAAGQVAVHRAYSPAVAAQFADGYFDYVYVDGVHSEDGALADLRAFDRKVKPGGLILGHDYNALPEYREMGFGVVEAVHRFVKETGYEFTLLTYDSSPTYVLAKDRASPDRQNLVAQVMRRVPSVVEIHDAENREFRHRHVIDADGKVIRALIGYR